MHAKAKQKAIYTVINNLHLYVQSLQDNIKPRPCHVDRAITQSVRQVLSFPVKTTLSVDNHYIITESEVVSTERLRLLQEVVYYMAYELNKREKLFQQK